VRHRSSHNNDTFNIFGGWRNVAITLKNPAGGPATNSAEALDVGVHFQKPLSPNQEVVAPGGGEVLGYAKKKRTRAESFMSPSQSLLARQPASLETVHNILGSLVARYRQEEVLTTIR
jgi:hypothetical protein